MIDGSSCSRMKFASLIVSYTIYCYNLYKFNTHLDFNLNCVFSYFTFISILSFISYTSEPAKGTFILAAGGRSGTLFWGGSRGGENGGVPGGGGGGAGRGARGVGRAHV